MQERDTGVTGGISVMAGTPSWIVCVCVWLFCGDRAHHNTHCFCLTCNTTNAQETGYRYKKKKKPRTAWGSVVGLRPTSHHLRLQHRYRPLCNISLIQEDIRTVQYPLPVTHNKQSSPEPAHSSSSSTSSLYLSQYGQLFCSGGTPLTHTLAHTLKTI